MTKKLSKIPSEANTCTNCGSDRTVKIIYGYVDAVLIEYHEVDGDEKEDDTYYGGCIVDTDSPSRHCNACLKNY
jgi:hypothetical protein